MTKKLNKAEGPAVPAKRERTFFEKKKQKTFVNKIYLLG